MSEGLATLTLRDLEEGHDLTEAEATRFARERCGIPMNRQRTEKEVFGCGEVGRRWFHSPRGTPRQ
jgi:hypothetical protein